MALPMSPRRLPDRAAAIPASIPRRVASTSSVTTGGTGPMVQVRAQSACQPSRMQPMSMLTRSPSARRRRGDGMPCTTSSLMLAQIDPGNGGLLPYPLNDGMAPASRIIRSAMASRSPVVTPGRSSARSTSRMAARICPAPRMRSISDDRFRVTAPVLRMIAVSAPRRCADGREDRLGDRLDRLHAVEPLDDARAFVVVDHLQHRGDLLLEPRANDLGPIVVALPELGPVPVAATGDVGRIRILVIRRAALRADPAAGNAPNENLGRNVDVQHRPDPLAVGGEGLVERLRLADRARKAVEDGAC